MFIGQKVVYIGCKNIPSEHLKKIIYNLKEGLSENRGGNLVEGKVYVIEKFISLPEWQGKYLGLALVGGITAYCNKTGKEIGRESRLFEPLEYIQLKNKLEKNVDEYARLDP